MNWRRGLFRLWAVISSVWVVAVFVAVNPVQSARQANALPTAIIQESADGVSHEFPGDTEQAVIDRTMNEYAASHPLTPSQTLNLKPVTDPAILAKLNASSTEDLTLEQKRALAIANARARMAQDVVMPDGAIIQWVPEGTTKAQLAAKYPGHLGPRWITTFYHFLLAFLEFAAWAFIPPLLLIAAGVAGLWVCRGFRTTSDDEARAKL